MSWETVIGLEIHAQLATRSKIFSGSPTRYGADPNTQASLIDLAYPGVLPVLNEKVVEMAVRFGLAVNAKITERSVFARKNYFYPDLPKGYQISQYELPIVGEGHLDIRGESGDVRQIGITRAHLEEDAGKSLHDRFDGESGIDLNRAGMPLLEIVSEPDLRSAVEAVTYMRKIHALVQYLGICDGNMQEGSFRCDANVSVRQPGAELGTRTELKNLNSFRFIEKAINFEIERQIEVIEEGGKIRQETRLYDADRDETRPMRGKEEANDYRYFPDPDLLPVVIDAAYIDALRADLPELPEQKCQRFQDDYGLRVDDAALLCETRPLADFYEAVAKATAADPQVAANWVLTNLGGQLNRDGLEISHSKVSPGQFAELLDALSDGTVSGNGAKEVFEAMWQGEGRAQDIIEARGLRQISDDTLIEALVDQVIGEFPDQVTQYREGKTKVIGFLVGKVMQASQGKANPGQVNALLKRKLDA